MCDKTKRDKIRNDNIRESVRLTRKSNKCTRNEDVALDV